MDYRALTQVTVKTRYPLPLMTELGKNLNTAIVFTKLDLNNRYHLLQIAKEDEERTAFHTRFGLCNWRFLPFSPCSAPTTFQSMIDNIFLVFFFFGSNRPAFTSKYGRAPPTGRHLCMMRSHRMGSIGLTHAQGKNKNKGKKTTRVNQSSLSITLHMHNHPLTHKDITLHRMECNAEPH